MDAKAEYRAVAVITRGAAGAAVLAEPEGAGWRLPAFLLGGVPDSRALAPALRVAAAQRFGLAVGVLAVLDARRGPEGEPHAVLVAADALAAPQDGPEPARARWLGHAELAALTFEGEAEAGRVRGWLASLGPGAAHPLRVPWARPGWLPEASAWVKARLAAAGLVPAGPVEQGRTWSLSALLSVPLTDGTRAYFKALPPFFGAEPAVTQALAARLPAHLPRVIAIDSERAWLLMEAFSGPLLQDNVDLPTWQAALRGYARLQASTAGEAEALLALGVGDRRLYRLPGDLAVVLDAPEHLRLGQADGLSAQELESLRGLLPALATACAALAACGVPDTLEHGDLHGNNIALTEAGPVYFDWSDACLAHPFTCLTTFLETVRPEWQAALTDSYLAEWAATGLGHAALRRAARLAGPLGAAHLAVSYHHILAGTEPAQRDQLGGALPFFLKEVLRLREGLDA